MAPTVPRLRLSRHPPREKIGVSDPEFPFHPRSLMHAPCLGPTRLPGAAVLLGAAFLLMGEGAHAQLPAGADAAWEDVTRQWSAAVESEGVVGASLALVYDGRLEGLALHGLSEVGPERWAPGAEGDPGARDVPVDEHTIYHWASITKTVTALAVMQLRDRGLLDLDDPIVRYVPELREVYNPFGPMDAVTVRHLLSHSAGFRAPTWPWGGDQPWHPHEPTEWSQLVAMMPYTRLHFEPGTRFSYSNPGIIFLGRLIEVLTGDVFEAYVQKNVFRPLGMEQAYFDVTPWDLLAHRSNNFRVAGSGVVPQGKDFNTGITVSNGGLNAPVGDMARYAAFLMGTHPAGDAVLRRASLDEMWEAVVPVGDTDFGAESMGLSWFLYDTPAGRLVGHTGTQKAFYSFLIVDPGARVAVLGAFNSVGQDGGAPATSRLRIETRDRMVQDLFPAFQRARDAR